MTKMMDMSKKINSLILITLLLLGYSTKSFAQTSESVLYVPLVGITSVPEPLALPEGSDTVTYNYAVKNFLAEVALNNVEVTDDKCSPVKFVTGDDNHDSKLNYSETWRYACTTTLYSTTQSTATVRGISNNITATHKAYATVVVGSNNPPPLISIINITKVAYPLSLPVNGGEIVFTYKVNNPGVVPLSDVLVTDDKCSAMSSRLGDTNGNNLLDINEVWIYTCTAILSQTTTNTVKVTGFANGLKAVGEASITVKVASPMFQPSTNFPETGSKPSFKILAWGILSGILIVFIIIFFLIGKNKNMLDRNQ